MSGGVGVFVPAVLALVLVAALTGIAGPYAADPLAASQEQPSPGVSLSDAVPSDRGSVPAGSPLPFLAMLSWPRDVVIVRRVFTVTSGRAPPAA